MPALDYYSSRDIKKKLFSAIWNLLALLSMLLNYSAFFLSTNRDRTASRNKQRLSISKVWENLLFCRSILQLKIKSHKSIAIFTLRLFAPKGGLTGALQITASLATNCLKNVRSALPHYFHGSTQRECTLFIIT